MPLITWLCTHLILLLVLTDTLSVSPTVAFPHLLATCFSFSQAFSLFPLSIFTLTSIPKPSSATIFITLLNSVFQTLFSPKINIPAFLLHLSKLISLGIPSFPSTEMRTSRVFSVSLCCILLWLHVAIDFLPSPQACKLGILFALFFWSEPDMLWHLFSSYHIYAHSCISIQL